jgi:5-methylcytosine-specific restriction endonuclease McrA
MSGRWGGTESKRLIALVKQEKGYLCHLCLKEILSDDDYHADHIQPRAKGGDNSLENLAPSHKACNLSRGDRSIEYFRASHTDNRYWFMALPA